MDTGHGPTGHPLTIAHPNQRFATGGALIIAQGTPYEVIVRDVRSLYKWSKRGRGIPVSSPHRIVYHHTGTVPTGPRRMRGEVLDMAQVAHASEWGLPYNFIAMAHHPFRLYYLNDVAYEWPHTLDYNGATAIAAWGNFSTADPPPAMVGRMTHLADALATMWGTWVEEVQHRDVTPTECPGNRLSPLLPSLDRQRDAVVQVD